MTCLLSVAVVGVALVTLGPEPAVAATALAFDPDGPLAAGAGTWWLVHGSLGHLLVNLTVLWVVAPSLERHVGSPRTLLAVVAGVAGGGSVHVAAHGAGVPILGTSSVVAALAAYNLVVGWHCPMEDRRGRPVLWPSHLFHGVVTIEVVRTLSELATGGAPTGAAAHLGGLAAGVVVCGVLHGRWPSRPASRAPLRSRPVVAIRSST